MNTEVIAIIASSVGLALSVLGSASLILWKIGRWTAEVESWQKATEASVEELKQKVGAVEAETLRFARDGSIFSQRLAERVAAAVTDISEGKQIQERIFQRLQELGDMLIRKLK